MSAANTTSTAGGAPSVSHPVPLPNSTCGAHMYAQGFGTWRGEKGLIGAAVINAIKAGYRLIDCARMYGNEAEIGEAIKHCLDNGMVKREELYIVTKIWNTDHEPTAHVAAAAKQSIKDLQCEYLDLLLMHWPVAWVHPEGGKMEGQTAFYNLNAETGGSHMLEGVTIVDTYKAMEALVDAKLVKDIGVSNFSIAEVEAILADCKYRPVANQVEVHPALPQDELRDFCESKGIKMMSYKPYGIDGSDVAGGLLYNDEIKQIAADAGLPSAPQLLLQWNCQKGNVALCKSTTPERIATNAAVPIGGLSEATMAAVAAFSAKNRKRLCNPDIFKGRKELYFKE